MSKSFKITMIILLPLVLFIMFAVIDITFLREKCITNYTSENSCSGSGFLCKASRGFPPVKKDPNLLGSGVIVGIAERQKICVPFYDFWSR